MANVFISYSRKDIEFAKHLTTDLKQSKIDSWIDWEGIPPTVDWWKEIEKGIEEADVFLFLISIDSAKSKVCEQEINCAIQNGKRLIPLVVREIQADETPEPLRHLNWIFFNESNEYAAALDKLKLAIHTDYDWVQTHRRLQVKALEWERSNKEGSFLLRGRELHDAEFQLATNTSKEPYPTNLQREYVFRSRRAADTQRRIVTAISIVGLFALAGLAVFGFAQANNANTQAATAQVAKSDAQSASTLAVSNASTAVANEQEARNQSRIARNRELATLAIIKRPTNYALSLLLGLEVFDRMPDLRSARGIMLNSAQMNPQLIQYLAGHHSFVYSVAFSPDGKILASGSADKTIILWDMATRQPIGQPLTSSSGAYSIAFSPDGKTLVSANVDDTIILWDVATHKLVRTPITDHTSGVNSVAFSPDGQTLAWGRQDGSIILWDLASGQRIGDPLIGHDGAVWKVLFSPDGKILASGGEDANVILWDVATRQPIGDPLSGHEWTVWSLAFSPDGKILASGSDDKSIILWNVATHQPIGDPLKSSSGVYTLAFSPTDKSLAAGYADNDIILWDTTTHQPIGQPLMGHSNWVNSLAFSPDGKIIASGSEDSTIILWSTTPQTASEDILTGHGAEYGVAFSPDGRTLASGGDEDTIQLWDVATHQLIGDPLKGHTDWIWKVNFSPDGKMIASASADQTIILWDAAKHAAIGKPLSGHTGTVWNVVFSPDGKLLASGADDGTAILWDVATGQPIGQPLPVDPEGAVYGVTFSPDGNTLAAASYDGTVTLWDVATHKRLGEPLTGGHGGILYSVAFSPDGKLLASGGDEGNIVLWDVATLKPLGEPLTGHSAIYSLIFSPDGNTLAAGTLDGTINLWDISTLEAIGEPLTGHNDYINSLAFSPDGKLLASGSADGSIILRNLDPQIWVDQTCQKVGRNFTLAEWTFYFPNEKYRKTCPQWPLEAETVVAAAVTPITELIPPTQASTAVATPTLLSNPTPADTYTEEFDGNLESWSGFMTTGDRQQVTTTLANSSFRVQLSPFEDTIPWAYWINNSFTYTNVQLQAVVTNNGNNANGVSLICQRNDYGWYEFTISNAGLYTIYVFDPSLPPLQGHIALATGGSAAIKTGKATNTYTATCKGNELSLSINGVLTRTVTDTLYGFTEGKIGIGVSSPQRLPIDVQFESLTVSMPQ